MTAVQILTDNLLNDLNADLTELLCDELIMPEVLRSILKSMNQFAEQEGAEFVTRHFGENLNLIREIKTKYEINN